VRHLGDAHLPAQRSYDLVGALGLHAHPQPKHGREPTSRAAFGALFAADGVVDDGGTIYEGRDAIVGFYLSPEKTWSLERTSEVVQRSRAGSTFASHTFSVPSGSGILVYELDGNLQILRRWIRY